VNEENPGRPAAARAGRRAPRGDRLVHETEPELVGPATASRVIGPLRALVDGLASARPVPSSPVATAIAMLPSGSTESA